MTQRITLAKARAYYQELLNQEKLLNKLCAEARNMYNHETWCTYYEWWQETNMDMWFLETQFRDKISQFNWLDKLIVFFFGK